MVWLKLISLLGRVKPTHMSQHLQHWAVTFKHFMGRIKVFLFYEISVLYRSLRSGADEPKPMDKYTRSILYPANMQKTVMVTWWLSYTEMFKRKNAFTVNEDKRIKVIMTELHCPNLLSIACDLSFYKEENIRNCIFDILLSRPSMFLFSA